MPNDIGAALVYSRRPIRSISGNCSDSRGFEGLRFENRGRIPVWEAQADGNQTAFDQFDPPNLNFYNFRRPLTLKGGCGRIDYVWGRVASTGAFRVGLQAEGVIDLVNQGGSH